MKLLLSILFLTSILFCEVEFKLIESWKLESSKEIILFSPGYFDISSSENLIIPDQKSCYVYNFAKDGSLVQKLGKKGVGPGEFIRPKQCVVNEGKMAVFDVKLQRVLIYQMEKNRFKLVNTVKQSGILNGSFYENLLVISGFWQDAEEKEYSVFSYDTLTNTIQPLIPTYVKFGFKNDDIYMNNRRHPRLYGFTKSEFLAHIGHYAFLSWVGNLRVIRVDLQTGNMVVFGKKTSKYVEPVFSSTLEKAVEERNWDLHLEELKKFSHVRQLFATRSNLFVYVVSPEKRYLQAYTLGGKFLGEAYIPKEIQCHQPLRVGFSKFNECMYIMNLEESAEKSLWKVFKYRPLIK